MPARVPTTPEQARIAAEAAKGSDSSLPANDRRSRARISARTHIAPGTVVRVEGEPGEKAVVGPGRGNGWVLLSWVDESVDCFGTYHESQVVL